MLRTCYRDVGTRVSQGLFDSHLSSRPSSRSTLTDLSLALCGMISHGTMDTHKTIEIKLSRSRSLSREHSHLMVMDITWSRRITLAISASTLTGLNPREDPFLMTIVAAFSLGHLTKAR